MARFVKTGLTATGWIFAIFALLGLMVSLPRGITGMDISMIIFFAIVGTALIYAGKKTVIPSNDKTLDQNEIAFNSPANNLGDTRQVICDSCGANIHVNARSGGECEYCGSYVSLG